MRLTDMHVASMMLSIMLPCALYLLRDAHTVAVRAAVGFGIVMPLTMSIGCFAWLLAHGYAGTVVLTF